MCLKLSYNIHYSMAISEEDWTEISNILDDPFSDEMEEKNKPEFVATKIDKEGCRIHQPLITEDIETNDTDLKSSNMSLSQCEKGESYSDIDLNIPLAKLQKGYSRTKSSKRALFQSSSYESESEFDDDVKDPTYKVHQKELNNSDSDTDSYKIKIPHRRQKVKTKISGFKKACLTNGLRDKNWKRKQTALSRKKRVTPGRPYVYYAIQKAKQESYKTYRARTLLKETHQQNLDALLASNGLKRTVMEIAC
ncbi:hypothetical protein DPMN_135188 [Dreissena polymorpha]|uniref:Uncharacterized protein n=1 Tax=Dreissena polymorpha TaxID=45954 RepID=A0A9D4FXK2_DREPO|nr:hypothetical protein DPMN_135188 [Dreissena polymorpha]